jgi:DUF1680 family protein
MDQESRLQEDREPPGDGTSPRPLTRRDALRILGVGTVGAGLSTGLGRELDAAPRPASGVPLPPPPAPGRPAPPLARPFRLDAVELLDSPFTDARERDGAYMLSLDADRLLHNFHVNAGLEPKAPVYGGWESQEPWVDIRCHGHTLGHWLTAGSLMFAGTGDRRFRERVDYIVGELARCQESSGSGLVCAFPDGAEQLENAVRGERFVGVPWYTMHKIFAGLRDAHVHGGSPEALQVLVRLAEWAVAFTAHMTDADFQRMLDREHGGMNEVLADVHVLTGDDRFLALARSFSHEALLQPLADGVDPLTGLHANTQIPKVIGFQRIYELTGDERFGRAARFFWDTVVHDRSWVTGGHGDVEHFFPPERFPRHLGSAKTSETCGMYNMLRLTRSLFEGRPSAGYADYYERALYNGILASQDPDSGWNTYFQATRPGYVKLYHTPIDSFWCCTGSGLENHAKYNDSIYFRDDESLWVNLFIPSSVRWEEKGLTLRQETRFPEEDVTRLSVAVDRPTRATLRIRHPGWSRGVGVTVNGDAVEPGAGPGEYIVLEREWRDGDRVEVRLPMSLRTEPLPGEPRRVAILYGPLVLAGRLGDAGLYPGADILRNERTSGMILEVPVEVPALATSPDALPRHVRPVPGEPLTFRTEGIGRPRDVTLVPYHRLHHERYTLYWELA